MSEGTTRKQATRLPENRQPDYPKIGNRDYPKIGNRHNVQNDPRSLDLSSFSSFSLWVIM